MTLPALTPIQTDDRIEIMGRGTYNVTAVKSRDWETSRRVGVKGIVY